MTAVYGQYGFTRKCDLLGAAACWPLYGAVGLVKYDRLHLSPKVRRAPAAQPPPPCAQAAAAAARRS